MNTDSSWNSIQKTYAQNLESLKTSINLAEDSTVKMNEIYSQVIRKSDNTSPQTLKKFADLWTKNIDFESLESSSELEKRFGNLLYDFSQKDFQDFGLSLQQQVYEQSITGLDAYRVAMEAFYRTWKKMWPN